MIQLSILFLGEDYESVHSTFCMKSDVKDSEIWLSEDHKESDGTQPTF
jgi:hypothetical protein